MQIHHGILKCILKRVRGGLRKDITAQCRLKIFVRCRLEILQIMIVHCLCGQHGQCFWRAFGL